MDGVNQIFRYAIRGDTFSTEQITYGTPHKVRPIAVVNGQPELQAMWAEGDPSSPPDYDCGAVGFGIAQAGTAVGALDDLSDVVLTAPAEGDTLRYVSGQWVNDNRRWEAVTDGADTFVWEGDDLVHEWSEY